jgi:hypothetical protein
MKVACIIPTYNFLEGVKRIAQWISKEYHLSVSDYRIIIVDDHSDSIYRSDFNRLSKLENFHILSSSGIRSLRLSILTGYDYIKEWNPDLIHIIETDAMPLTSTFQAMLRVYQEAAGNVGSEVLYIHGLVKTVTLHINIGFLIYQLEKISQLALLENLVNVECLFFLVFGILLYLK